MARRSDHSRDELKELILEKSWQIIEKKGFSGLTAREIADRVGYAPGTIYNIFKSMDDLALHINARTLDILNGVLSDPVCRDPDKTPAENMKVMVKCYIGFIRKYRPYWLMLFDRDLPDKRKSLSWYQEKIDRLFVPLEGLLSPYFTGHDEKRGVAARVLWASVHGLCFLQETGKISVVNNDGNVPDLADYLIDNFVKGLEQK